MMNLLFTITDNYAPYCGVALTSFLVNNNWTRFDVYIITDGLTENNRNRLSKICSHYQAQFFYFELSDNIKKQIKIISPYLPRNQKSSFLFRLFMTELLPEHIDAILYLDSDLIINDTCKELQNIVFDSKTSLYAIKDTVRWADYERLKINFQSHQYFNSGVMYLNIKYWKREHVMERCISFICNTTSRTVMVDQDALNVVLKGTVKYLHPKFNCLSLFFAKENYVRNRVLKDDYNHIMEAIKRPVIIHYVLKKPWHKGDYVPKREIWFHYLAMTEWRNMSIGYKDGLKGFAIYSAKQILRKVYAVFGRKYKESIY